MNRIQLGFLFIISIHFAFSNEESLMGYSSRNSRSELKKEYERCKKRQHSDLPSDNKIEDFDVSGLRRRNRFSSLDSGEHSKPKSKVVAWPRGEVPIQLEKGFTEDERSSLKCAILYFHAHTCLTFLNKNKTHQDYVFLTKTNKQGGCFTEVIGKKGGGQILNLDPANDHCWQHGTIIHELMHVLGFFHEHSRSDRNKHLVIHWNNIPKAFHFQYWTTEDMGYEHKDVGKYDFGSVMHYSRYLGFNLGLSAKVHNDDYEKQAQDNDAMGQRMEPSDEDTNKLNLMYCPNIIQLNSNCKDQLDCTDFVSLCQSSELVKTKCRKTCGLCDIAPKSISSTQPTTPSRTTSLTTVTPKTTNCINMKEGCAKNNLPECMSNMTAHLNEWSIVVNKSTTVSGTKCKNWHKTWLISKYPNLGNHNFCRNPGSGKSAGPWCFVENSAVGWEFCYPSCTRKGCINTEEDCARNNFNECKVSDTAHLDLMLVTVNKSTTVNGHKCQKWSHQWPNLHNYSYIGDHNYCRNPNHDPGPWCFTEGPHIGWDLCYRYCPQKEKKGCINTPLHVPETIYLYVNTMTLHI